MSTPSRRGTAAPLLLALALGCSGHPGALDGAGPPLRLPGDARPAHYDLSLAIDPAGSRFSGRAVITVELARRLDVIWLHGRDLDVRAVALSAAAGDEVAARWEAADRSGLVAVRLSESTGPGTVRLRVDYEAAFGDKLRGLYRVDAGGAAYAFTHFEPISARQAFPGFDEPAFKAPFDVSLVVCGDCTAVANTPSVSERVLPDGRKRVRFATTPPLPTYLLAWAVGPLDLVEAPPLPPHSGRARAIPFRGVAARGRGPELARALERTPLLLAALEEDFGIPYPFAKLDLVAVPEFGPGAMENAGAIFVGEQYLLQGRTGVSEAQRRSLDYVMAHELAHQWFGNLVSMAWWDDLWLSEAFATWMGRRIEARVFPENGADVALLEAVHWAMRSDEQASARSIRQPVEDHHDVSGAFDVITYDKGAGVLAMFERWLGAETFRAGITRYLTLYRDASATQADLLDALSHAAGRDVGAPFRSFLVQPGVPLVEVASACDASGGGVRLRQSRQLPLGSSAERDLLWQIPVCIRYGVAGGVRTSCQLLAQREARLALPGGCPDWLVPNAAGAGYYRTALAEDAGRDLLERGWTHLDARERLAVASDLEAAFRSGAASPAAVFGGLAPLAADADPRVARAPMSLLELAREHLVGADGRAAVDRLGAELYGPRLARIGWEAQPGEGGDVKLLRRSLVAYLALGARDPDARREAARRGRRYAGLLAAPDAAALEPELVETALAVVVQEGDAADFDALLARLHDTEAVAARRDLLRALASARDPELAARARALALDSALRVSEVWTPLYRQSQAADTRDATWRFIEANFDSLVARAGGERSAWMPWLAAGFCTGDRADAVAAFLGPRIDALPGGPRNLAGSLEAIRLCAALAARQGPGTRRFFADRP